MSSEELDQQYGGGGNSGSGSNGGGEDPNASAGADGSGAEFGGEGEFVAHEEGKPKVSPTTLAMIGVIALGAGAVWLMYQRAGGPSSASAASAADIAASKKTINKFLDNDGENVKNMEQMLKDTQKYVQQFLNPMIKQVPLSELRQNPFREKVGGPKNDDALNARKREEERLAMLKAVQGLQLQSIMYGEQRRACMINNTLYREGQQVDAFSVEKITATSVIVKSGAYRFELKMQK